MTEPNLPTVLLIILSWLISLTVFVAYWAGRTSAISDRLDATTKKPEEPK